MTELISRRRDLFGKLLAVRLSVAVIVLPISSVMIGAPQLGAQASSADWVAAAGGQQTFEVASVKQNKLNGMSSTNVPLNDQDGFSSNGGLFSVTNYRLDAFIGFAYKITSRQTQAVLSQLPKWAAAERFDIQARAEGNPTKDQMRLMMQSLLAERFKLAVHTEVAQAPVFALVLVKPERPGPTVKPHSDRPPCALLPSPGAPGPASPSTDATGLPAVCGVLQTELISGRMRAGARNVTVEQFVSYLPAAPISTLDRPVIDETGLNGKFDLTLEWRPEAPIKLNGANVPLDENGPTFLEALREQLGIKFEPKTGPVETIVIDHVEEPSGN
jgi:uncharacterized protein (TIGR03435 family)